MGVVRVLIWRACGPFAALSLLAALGCVQQVISTRSLFQHQALVEMEGLQPVRVYDALHVTCAMPRKWENLPDDKGMLYDHVQWRSPSLQTGIGVAYIHTPLPLSAQVLIWFAKAEYTKKQTRQEPGGRVIGEWTDALGRAWFEAENDKYHVKGYAMTRGFDSWIVYTGYRVKSPPNWSEIGLAARAADSVAPMSGTWTIPVMASNTGAANATTIKTPAPTAAPKPLTAAAAKPASPTTAPSATVAMATESFNRGAR